MKKSTDNLNRLLRHFVENAAADSMAEEIRLGDELLERFPTPSLSPQAAERIRLRLHASRRHHRRTILLGWSSVAAAAVIGILVFWTGLRSPAPSRNQSIAQAQIHKAVRAAAWEETLFAESEKSLSAINAELDSIAETIEAAHCSTKNEMTADCFWDDGGTEQEDQNNTADLCQG